MQWMVIGFLVLAICELPVFHAKKFVVMMPRQMRRTPSSPWRHVTMMMRAKKSSLPEHAFRGHRPGYPPASQFYRPKDLHFAKHQYPQGGDDFDQGHEEVNNVILPHGKGITHAVSFGKGYIPFDSYKDHRTSNSHHHDYRLEGPVPQDARYAPPMNYPSGLSFAHPYMTQQVNSYAENEASSQNEFQDRIQERGAKKYGSGKPLHDSSNPGAIGTHYGVAKNVKGLPGKTGVYLSSGIHQATLGGGKQGIVLRDSIVLDDYHRKIAELTKNWPSSFSDTNLMAGTIGPNTRHQGSLQQTGLSRQFDPDNNLQGSTAGTNLLSSPSQDKGQQGYAVTEDVIDTPHDFRTMPIQTAPVQPQRQHVQQILQPQQPVPQIIQQQQPLPQIIRQPLPHIIQQQQPLPQIIQQQQPLQQIIHSQPVHQTLQHIFPQSQVPVNYALPNHRAYVRG